MSTELGKPHVAQATFDAQKAARQQAFLAAFAQSGTIYKAANAVGISRETVRLWERDDPEFLERLKEAHAQFGDYLQDLALQKVERLESKDNLLHLAMLNAHVPELYAPERQRFTVQDNRSVTIINNYPAGPRQLRGRESVTDGAVVDADSSHRLPPGHPDSGHKDTTESVDETDS